MNGHSAEGIQAYGPAEDEDEDERQSEKYIEWLGSMIYYGHVDALTAQEFEDACVLGLLD